MDEDLQVIHLMFYYNVANFVSFIMDEDVQIIDNNSKEDITNVTLAQIIYEEEKKGGSEPRRGNSLKHFIQEGRQRLLTSFRDSPMSQLVNRYIPNRIFIL